MADEHELTPLQYAVMYSDKVEVVEQLIESGADIGIVTANGRSLVHLAVLNSIPMTKYVLSLGLDINGTDDIGLTPLHHAIVYSNSVEMVCFLIESGADIKNMTSNRKNLLHLAVINRDISVVKFVISLGLDIDSVDEMGWTPLHCAVRNNENVDIVKLLVESGADIQAVTEDGKTLCHLAVINSIPMTKYVLSLGLDINSMDIEGLSPLHYVVGYNENTEIVSLLIQSGADIHITTMNGVNLLHSAAMNNAVAMVKYVLDLGFDINDKDNNGWTPLCYASRYSENVEIIELLLESGADVKTVAIDGKSLLHLVAFNSKLSVVHYVLGLGFDINDRDKNDWTPLHYAAKFNPNVEVLKFFIGLGANIKAVSTDGLTLLHVVATNSSVSVVNYILSFDFDINGIDVLGWTPLQYAVRYNQNTDAIKLLLEVGADAEVVSPEGWNLVHLAAVNNIFVTDYVLSLGLDINSKDAEGLSPLQYAVRYGDNIRIVKLLVDSGADVKVLTSKGASLLHLAVLNNIFMTAYVLSLGFDVNSTDEVGWTPLHTAAVNTKNGGMINLLIDSGAHVKALAADGKSLLHLVAFNSEKSVVETILSLGLDINGLDEYGSTPLQYAVRYNENIEVIKLLIASGGDIKAVTPEGGTLLHFAVLNSKIAVAQYILTLGLDINSMEKNGCTPLHYAAKEGKNVEVVKLLVELGADVKAVTKAGASILHYAALNSEITIVQYVLGLGLDINSIDEEGWTPLHCAMGENTNMGVVKILLESGADADIKTVDGQTPLHFAMHNPAFLEYLKSMKST